MITAKKYLSQAYRLDQRINADLEEVARLRVMASSISSPSWEEKTGGTRSTDPPYVKCIIKIIDLERHIDEEVDKLGDVLDHIIIFFVYRMSASLILAYPPSLAFTPAYIDPLHPTSADGTHHGDGQLVDI